MCIDYAREKIEVEATEKKTKRVELYLAKQNILVSFWNASLILSTVIILIQLNELHRSSYFLEIGASNYHINC